MKKSNRPYAALDLASVEKGEVIPENKSKVGDRSQRWPEDFFFNNYYTEVLERALLLPLDCSTLPLIRTL